jgi:hypothetical protein
MRLNPIELSRRLLDDPAVAADLREVDPLAIPGQEARVAFWLNVYNARLSHELRERPRRGSLLRHRALFRFCEYRVGDFDYSLDVIEHGVLRLNARPPYSPRRLLRAADPRRDASPPRLDPRVHFALNCGARSCPLVRPYQAERLDEQLKSATRAYLAQEARVERQSGQVVLPGLCKLYARDFGGRAGLVRFAEEWLGESLEGLRLRFASFDWTLAVES